MFYQQLLQERQRILDIIEQNNEKIRNLPEGTFYCIESGTQQKWYQKIEGHKQQYISKKDQEHAAKLAYKRFLEAQNEDLKQEAAAIDAYLAKCPKDFKSQTLLEKKGYQDLISNFFQPLNQELQAWAQAPFTQNPYRPEGKSHYVRPGLSVRSKAEVLIATQLQIHKIPFRYECELQIGPKTYYPDFTLRHPETGETFYWEHMGLLDDAAYATNAARKMQQYAQGKIYLNRNLILTSEGLGQPLTIHEIEKNIRYIIQ